MIAPKVMLAKARTRSRVKRTNHKVGGLGFVIETVDCSTGATASTWMEAFKRKQLLTNVACTMTHCHLYGKLRGNLSDRNLEIKLTETMLEIAKGWIIGRVAV
jgi:hypothetical protein